MIELEYTEIDGLLYPNIETGIESIENDLGKYGILRLRFLHKYKPALYRKLLLTGKLAQHCNKIEHSAFEIAERIQAQYLEQHPAPIEGMERIQTFTLAQSTADEIVLTELICN